MLSFFRILFLGGALTLSAATHVAILPFTSDASIDTAQKQSITQKFQSELLAKNVYNILERSQLELILQEQSLQSSGACDASNCQVQLGKLLSVDKLITGSLVRFDDTYVLNTNLLDVQTGSIERSWFTKVKGSITDVLAEGAPLAAKQVTASELNLPFATDTLITGSSRLRQEEAARAAAMDAQKEKRQQKHSQLVKSSLLALSAIVVVTGLGGGLYNNGKANSDYEDYSAISGTDARTQTALNDTWDKLRNHENKRDKFYGLAGFGVALFLGTSIFF